MYKLGKEPDVVIISSPLFRSFPVTRKGLEIAIKGLLRVREDCGIKDMAYTTDRLALFQGALEFLDQNQTKGEEK